MAKSNAQRQQEWRDRQKAAKLAALPKAPLRGRRNEANSIIEFAGQLTCPNPPLAGQRFKLGGWQQKFLRGALAADVATAALCCARKNGKTGLIAVVLAAYLVGPLNRPRWRGLVLSLTSTQTEHLQDQVQAILEASGKAEGVRFVRGRIDGLQGARVDFLASSSSTGQGSDADLAIIDEAGLIEPNAMRVWTAVNYSLGARDGRLICISVRGFNERFSALAERAKTDPSVYWQEHVAPEGCAIDDPKAWRAANPGLSGGIKSLEAMKREARAAKLSPSDETEFRTYQLNQPGRPTRDTIVTIEEWLDCVSDEPEEKRGPVVLGIDLGGAKSMCAAAAIWVETGRLQLWAAFPKIPDLKDRGRADGVGGRYEVMCSQGELKVLPGRVTPVAAFLGHVAADLEGTRVLRAGADRFREHDKVDYIDRARLGWKVEMRATGGRRQSLAAHDVRSFQRQVAAGELSSKEHLGMTTAILESELKYDDAGNCFLDKQRKKSRIDVLQAAVIAAGLRAQYANKPSYPGVYLDGKKL